MRLFIKKCLLFILVLLLLFPVCFYIWGEFIPQIFRNASNVRYIDESNDFMRLRIQEAKTISDIDILVEFDKPIGLDFVLLADELEAILGVKVDLVTTNALKPKMFEYIKQDLQYV